MEGLLTGIRKETQSLYEAIRAMDWQEAYDLAESIEATLAELRSEINKKQAKEEKTP